ncbi:proteinase-activated receptor 1-like [Aquarana catesbeiana]|uniref:proteinase-activated receptor 1-like n=1 Tax=Aquarana catesbeiana TaxID=8400 RepID=UPI003CCA1816
MKDSVFFLGKVQIYMRFKENYFIYENVFLKAFVTRLGHSYTCEEAIVRITPNVSIVLLDVEAQAFTLDGDTFPRGYVWGIQAATPRPTTIQNTPQCDNCPINTTKHHTTNLKVSHHPGLSYSDHCVCCVLQVTIPSPPTTEAEGSCVNTAELTLIFPEGRLTLTFRENKKDSSFSLGHIKIYIQEKEHNLTGIYEFQEALVTPLGHSFTCEEVILRISREVSVVLLDVKIQAFTKSSNFLRDDESTFIIYDMAYELMQSLYTSFRHWSVTRLVPSIYTVVFLVALPLNIMAIIIFLVKMKVRKPAMVYMLNLAIADTLLVSILPFYIVSRFLGNEWIFEEGMCRFVTAAFYCNMYCSVLLMTSISVDRFLAVVYPVRSLPWRTVTRAWLMCGVIWVISLASTVPILITHQTWKFSNLDNIFCHDIQFNKLFLVFYFYYFTTVISLFFFLPLCITTFCYIGIIHRLSRSKFDRAHKRSQAIRLSVIVLSVFVLCFGPTNVLFLIHYVKLFKSSDRSLYIPYILCISISSINCCLDPLIYYFAYPEYRRYVYSLLCCKKDYRPPGKQKSILKHKGLQPVRELEETYSTQSTKSG